MTIDPSLAYTALLELWPGFDGAIANRGTRDLVAELAHAMSAANPPDRWTYAKGWIDARRQLIAGHPGPDCHIGPPGCPDHDALARCWRLTEQWRALARAELPGQLTDAAPLLSSNAAQLEQAITGQLTTGTPEHAERTRWEAAEGSDS